MKPKTIDEFCKKEPGSFKKFVAKKKQFLRKLESEREDRIRAARQTAQEMSWAA